MPFMIGKSPIRRTLEYLERGQIVFKPHVKVMAINYNTGHLPSKGTQQFVFWYLPQVQYKNPLVQCVTFKNMTPSPFFQFFLGNGENILVESDDKTKEELHDHIKQIFGKTKETLREEALAQEKKDNPGNFGYSTDRWCMCEVPGQVPCPKYKPLPPHMRGKYKKQLEEQGIDSVYVSLEQQ